MQNYRIGASEVTVDEGVQVVRAMFENLGECSMCVVFDEGVRSVAEQAIFELKSVYRIFEHCTNSSKGEAGDPPEFVRHIFGVGTGSVAEECKRLSEKLNADWSLLMTAPTTDDILCGKSPKNVFIAKNVMLNCPFECLAAGYGILFSEPLRAFENMFCDKVLALGKAETAVIGEANDAVELALRLLEISAEKQGADSAELTARLMRSIAIKAGRKPRLTGEYKFLASSLIAEFYSAFLGAPSIDCMPPSSLDGALDMLSYLGAKEIIPPKRVDFFDANAYFRISYILSEYRMDLLDKLGGLDSRKKQRFWRRLYPDAGYWLKSEVTADELLRAMTLAGAFSDSLLGFAFASGLTARLCAG